MKKTAIVTGASRGFGRGIAHVLASEGQYKVFATARNKTALENLKREVDDLGCEGEIIPYVLDQNNDSEVSKFSEEVTKGDTKIDLLVNSAYQGLIAMTPHFGKRFWERPISVYDDHMNVGVRSSYVMSKLIVPNMIQNNSGLILQISSYGGFIYFCDVGYGVAHAAMDRLSYDMATELKDENVSSKFLLRAIIEKKYETDDQSDSTLYVQSLIFLVDFTLIIFFSKLEKTPISFNIEIVISIYGLDITSPSSSIVMPFFNDGPIKARALIN